jgi:hypothetical protein
LYFFFFVLFFSWIKKGEGMHIYIPIWLMVLAVVVIGLLILGISSSRCPMGGFHDVIEGEENLSDGPFGPSKFCTKCKKEV